MERNQFLGMSQKEILDTFLLDTFQPHTRRDRTMRYEEIRDCYKQWCEAMDIPVMGNHVVLGAALKRRFFCVKAGNVNHWFLEIKEELKEIDEALDDAFGSGDTTGGKSDLGV